MYLSASTSTLDFSEMYLSTFRVLYKLYLSTDVLKYKVLLPGFGIYHDFDAIVVKQKLGYNIVTVTNNVLHTFLKIFAVVKVLPCFPIIADTGTLVKNFRITKGTFLHEFCL